MSNADSDHVVCPQCGAEIRIPSAGPKLTVTCPECRWVIVPDLPAKPGYKRKVLLLSVLALAVLTPLVWYLLSMSSTSDDGSLSGEFAAPNWVTIRYGGLVDQNSLARGNLSIGHALYEGHTDATLCGLVQPCFEPFSILCHDALLALNGPDSLPLVNVVTNYPPNTAQPAWVALFREGDYQLYYNSELIRVFIEGSNIRSSINAHRPVLRHAVGAVLASANTAIKRIEIYNFVNDYDSVSIRLNTNPAIFTPEKFDLRPQHRPLDIASIHEFLKTGAMPEVLEVDSTGNFYLYGHKSTQANLAGSPLSLADLAVVYRSVFHCNLNPPYVSLDPDSNRRFTSVNFGGHLENTRIGDILLEADMCLKSLCSGIDPGTHKVINERIRRQIPDFLTEDQRALLQEPMSDHKQARIWLYPDSVCVVTDKSVGVVESDRFTADLERTVQKVPVKGYAQALVDHVNRNYSAYERAFPYLKDVRKIARLTALFDWLRRLKVDASISLDELLTVELPAYTTESHIDRPMALTAVACTDLTGLTRENVINNSRTYDLSNVISSGPSVNDAGRLMEAGFAYFRGHKFGNLVPPQFRDTKDQLDSLDRFVSVADGKLDSLDKKLNLSEKMINRADQASMGRHDAMVDQFNRLLRERNSANRSADSLYARLQSMNIAPYFTISIGGGISLRPKDFRRTYMRQESPLITRITSLEGKFKTDGNVSTTGDWIRSNPGEGRSTVHPLPSRRWTQSVNSGAATGYVYTSDGGNRLSLAKAIGEAGWQVMTTVDGVTDAVEFVENDRQLIVSHPRAAISGKGNFHPNNKMIEFHK